ncbi:sensor histidine kinase [Vibrio sp. YMD68]|uniref:ATP-binding protein n=1 Tax=Vibrio sp. YMD68 TaxID=3042300 RepID=UPI00249CF0A2|nr:sensor histidine kinase [Vibrio sp. YMD68]WGW01012.1 sensor histidine kinase [Vibrio sp. YMD68]
MASRFFPRSFMVHSTLLLCGALMLSSVGWWLVSTVRLNQVLAEQVALRAEVQSQQLAQLPTLLAAVEQRDTAKVSSIVDRLQVETDADFITVSDAQGVRLAHPIKSRIGLPVVGGDIDQALTKGVAYLSHGVGSLGPSVRYISPLFDQSGQVIGMIKVGYLKQSIAVLNEANLSPLLLFAGFSLLFSVMVAWRFSRYVRDKMQCLEPWQLNQALQTHQGVLQATHEGVMAINPQGEIYLVNDSARDLLGLCGLGSGGDKTPPLRIENLSVDAEVFALKGEDFLDRMVRINGRNLVMTRVTLASNDKKQVGAVFSLRAQKELHILSNKISQVDNYLESIRVTRHEYQNKISTVTGLLQLGHVDKALNVLLAQAKVDQANMDSVSPLESLPLISGLILANLGKAAEKGIHIDLTGLQGWNGLPALIGEQGLSSIIGNLIINSIDALEEATTDGWIRIIMYQTGSERVLSVSNNGPAIHVSLDVLCQLGFTTKGDYNEHGIGMHLVQSLVEDAGGYIELDSDKNETMFTVYFPEKVDV